MAASSAGATSNLRSAKTANPIDDQTQSTKARQALLVSLAQQEGKLYIYAASSSGVAALVPAFEAEYPFIKVTYGIPPVATMDAEISTALQTQSYNYDVIMEAAVYEFLYRQIKAIQPFYTPDAKTLASKYLDLGPKGEIWGLGQSQIAMGLLYNKNLMPSPPTTYEDLLNPEYNGKITVSNSASGYQWIGAIFADLGNKDATNFLTESHAFVQSALPGPTISSLVASGQLAAFAQGTRASFNVDIASNEPVGFEPIFTVDDLDLTMIASHPPDPAAAVLWADYVDSAAGTSVAENAGGAVAAAEPTADIYSPAPKKAQGLTFYPGSIKGLTYYKYNALFNQWEAIFTKYFG